MAREGLGRPYLEHVRWLDELCRRHGKGMMFWSDIIRKSPELIGQIPQDAVVLNWAYDADSDYDSTALFRDAGLCTYVCPGTSGWNRLVNDINNADLNIRRSAAAGKPPSKVNGPASKTISSATTLEARSRAMANRPPQLQSRSMSPRWG